MHGFAVHPLYAKGQQRRNIFFSQVCETLVGSRIHEKGRNKASASFALLVVNVPAIGEVMVRSLFDLLDLNGFALSHIGEQSRGRRRTFQTLFCTKSERIRTSWHSFCSLFTSTKQQRQQITQLKEA